MFSQLFQRSSTVNKVVDNEISVIRAVHDYRCELIGDANQWNPIVGVKDCVERRNASAWDAVELWSAVKTLDNR